MYNSTSSYLEILDSEAMPVSYDYDNCFDLDLYEPPAWDHSILNFSDTELGQQESDGSNEIEVDPIEDKELRMRRFIDQQINFILGSTEPRQKSKNTSNIGHKQIRKRIMKTKEQNEILFKELIGTFHVSREKINEVGVKLGLSFSQVYKWYWNHKHNK